MTTTMKRVTVAVLATTLVVALWSKLDRNTAIGAGAIGGSVLTNGSAVVGGIIGHQVD